MAVRLSALYPQEDSWYSLLLEADVRFISEYYIIKCCVAGNTKGFSKGIMAAVSFKTQ
jgi:hypothetical protein